MLMHIPQPPKGGTAREQGTGNKEQGNPLSPLSGSRGVERGGGNNLLLRMAEFLRENYEFRYNLVTEVTEYREKADAGTAFKAVGQRELNTLCLASQMEGIACWDRDVARFVNSAQIPSYHPFKMYMENLPAWDGTDRLEAMARRVSANPLWVKGFSRWMLGLAAQWTGHYELHANSVAPVLVSRRQGLHKSTFCRMLLPEALRRYYTDSFDMASVSASEQKLTAFGLINLDEMDKYTPRKMAQLKNLMQMAGMNIRKAYKKDFALLQRIASFIATSNRMDLLTDPTGSRRFLCVEVMEKIDCSPIDHAQLYAQLKAALESGEPYWFSEQEEAAIMKNNRPFQRQGMEEDVFRACFRLPEEGEKPVLLPGATIYARLKSRNPSAMRETPPSQFGKTLLRLGVERVHTEQGNLYRVMPVA